MSCNCHKAFNTGACIGNFTVGTATPNADYNVYFQIATGRTDVYAVTANADGLIVVDSPRVRVNHMYHIWINQPGQPRELQEPYIVNSTEVACIKMEFTACFDEDEYLAPVNEAIQLEGE